MLTNHLNDQVSGVQQQSRKSVQHAPNVCPSIFFVAWHLHEILRDVGQTERGGCSTARGRTFEIIVSVDPRAEFSIRRRQEFGAGVGQVKAEEGTSAERREGWPAPISRVTQPFPFPEWSACS